jgi:lysozyme family protein
MNLETALRYVIPIEGPDSNDPQDHAGQTRFGITAAEAAAHGFDIDTLTLEQAKTIYAADYLPSGLNGILSEPVAIKIFDMGVNQGVTTAVRLVQGALGVTVDGILGPKTILAINGISPDRMMRYLVSVAVRRYVDIALHDRTQLRFLSGWINRGLKVPT